MATTPQTVSQPPHGGRSSLREPALPAVPSEACERLAPR